MTIQWFEPWRPVSNEKQTQAIEAELKRELSAGHVLQGQAVRLIASSSKSDDHLFELLDGRVAEVHLTWKGSKELSPDWPSTEVFKDLAAWVDKTTLRE